MVDEVQTSPERDVPEAPALPLVTSPPITDRFLFVDVAAMRAKQLRRGARPRLGEPGDSDREAPAKPERVAMEEVRRGLIQYDVPEFKPKAPEPRI